MCSRDGREAELKEQVKKCMDDVEKGVVESRQWSRLSYSSRVSSLSLIRYYLFVELVIL